MGWTESKQFDSIRLLVIKGVDNILHRTFGHVEVFLLYEQSVVIYSFLEILNERGKEGTGGACCSYLAENPMSNAEERCKKGGGHSLYSSIHHGIYVQ